MAIMTLTSFRGWGLLQKAREISARTNDKDDAQATIVLGASAFEAFLAELEFHAGRDASSLPMQTAGAQVALLEAAHGQMAAKIDAVSLSLGGRRAAWGRKPLQDLAKVKWLRDRCVHPKPVRGSADKPLAKSPDVEFFLNRKLVTKKSIGGHLTWDNVLLTQRVAVWACDTVESAIHLVVGWLPPSETSRLLRVSWRMRALP